MTELLIIMVFLFLLVTIKGDLKNKLDELNNKIDKYLEGKEDK